MHGLLASITGIVLGLVSGAWLERVSTRKPQTRPAEGTTDIRQVREQKTSVLSVPSVVVNGEHSAARVNGFQPRRQGPGVRGP